MIKVIWHPQRHLTVIKKTLLKTFSYLNSALQHEGLNRGQWARLESFERSLANFFGKEIKVRVDVLFEGKLKKVKGGATIPSGFRKTITMGDIIKTFEFPNTDTKGTNWIEYLKKIKIMKVTNLWNKLRILSGNILEVKIRTRKK